MSNSDLGSILRFLRAIDNEVNVDFERIRKRPVDLADKQQKIIEELGEVIKALKNGEPLNAILDEITDTTIAAISQAFVLGFSIETIQLSFLRTFNKLRKRWLEQAECA